MLRCSHAEAGCFGSFTVTGLWLWYKQHSSSGLVPFLMFEVKVVKFPRKLGNFNKTRGLSLWSRAVRHLDFWTIGRGHIGPFGNFLPGSLQLSQCGSFSLQVLVLRFRMLKLFLPGPWGQCSGRPDSEHAKHKPSHSDSHIQSNGNSAPLRRCAACGSLWQLVAALGDQMVWYSLSGLSGLGYFKNLFFFKSFYF